MNDEQCYRVLFYAGNSLINSDPNVSEENARLCVADWDDEELARHCKVEPPLPTLDAPEVEGSTISEIPAKFHLVTYETVLGEFNIITDDNVKADVFMGEFFRELGMVMNGGEIVQSVTDGPPIHVVIIDGLTHIKSVHPSDIVKPIVGDVEHTPDDDVDIKPGLTE